MQVKHVARTSDLLLIHATAITSTACWVQTTNLHPKRRPRNRWATRSGPPKEGTAPPRSERRGSTEAAEAADGETGDVELRSTAAEQGDSSVCGSHPLQVNAEAGDDFVIMCSLLHKSIPRTQMHFFTHPISLTAFCLFSITSKTGPVSTLSVSSAVWLA